MSKNKSSAQKKTSTSLVKVSGQFHSPELAGLVDSLKSDERRSFIQAFRCASSKGQDFIQAVIELKRLTLKAKVLSWELVAEDLGFTFNALDARIYRYKHPELPAAPKTRVNIDPQVVETTTSTSTTPADQFTAEEQKQIGDQMEGSEDGGVENESEGEIKAQAEAEAKKAERNAKKAEQIITRISPLDSVSVLADKLAMILERVITKRVARRFKVTVEEIPFDPPLGPLDSRQQVNPLVVLQDTVQPAAPKVWATNAVKGCSYIYAPDGQAGEYSPLAANPYRGCGHGCVYCYVPSVLNMTRQEFDKGAIPRPDFIAKLTKDAIKYQEAGKSNQQVMLSFTTDPYHTGDTTLTRHTLEVLRDYGFGICALTKGGTRSLRDLDLFRPNRDAFASTLTSLEDAFSLKWERNAALPSDRIAALKAFHNAGIYTWVSLEPTLSVEASLAIVQKCHEFVDLFKIGRANYLKRITATTDWKQYTERMIELCAKLKVAHYIKKDLQQYLPAGYVNPLRVDQYK